MYKRKAQAATWDIENKVTVRNINDPKKQPVAVVFIDADLCLKCIDLEHVPSRYLAPIFSMKMEDVNDQSLKAAFKTLKSAKSHAATNLSFVPVSRLADKWKALMWDSGKTKRVDSDSDDNDSCSSDIE